MRGFTMMKQAAVLAALSAILTTQLGMMGWAEPGYVLTGSVRETSYQPVLEPMTEPEEPGIVGLDMTIRPGSYPRVDSVFRNTPAFYQGVQRGDLIIAINNEPTIGKSRAQVDEMISDIPGEQVMLTIKRPIRKKKKFETRLIQLEVMSLSALSEGIRSHYQPVVSRSNAIETR